MLLLFYAFTRRVPVPVIDAAAGGEFRGWEGKTLLGFSPSASLLRPWSWQLLRWLVELLGRMLLAMVLLVDAVVRVSASMWHHGRELEAAGRTADHDRAMAAVAAFVAGDGPGGAGGLPKEPDSKR